MSKFTFSGRVGETISLVFDFTEELQYSREDNYQYSLLDYVTIGAFIYECTNAGKTAHEQPDNVPVIVADAFIDGSVEWTCRDYGTSGTDTIATRSVTAGTGITVDSDAIQESVRVRADLTLTAVGNIAVTCEITTAAGETLKEAISIVAQ